MPVVIINGMLRGSFPSGGAPNRWRGIGAGVAMLLAGGLAFACSSATGPAPPAAPPPPTLLVTNNTCGVNGCRTLEVRAFVWKFRVPQEPYGLEVVGEVHADSVCLQLPSWTLSIEGKDSTGHTTDSTSVTWTPADTIPIYLFAVDSAVFHSSWTTAEEDSATQRLWPYDGTFPGGVGWTANFVVPTSPGWRVALPYVAPLQGSGPDVSITPTSACQLR